MANGAKVPSKSTSQASSTLPADTNLSQSASGVAVNRKKQKRRQKAAAKLAATQDDPTSPPSHASLKNSVVAPANAKVHTSEQSRKGYDGPPMQEDDDLTDSDDDSYDVVPTLSTNGHLIDLTATNGLDKKKKKKKKGKGGESSLDPSYSYSRPPTSAHVSSNSIPQTETRGRIWNTSTQEERERIKEFWQSLSETERKSLVKIEKDAVIKTMKEQQKHSCSCSVCGRKRTAIEEELEVLYDAYYNELEQYEYFQAGFDGPSYVTPSKNIRQRSSRSHLNGMPPLVQPPPPRGHIQPSYPDDEYDDEDYDEDDDEINDDSEDGYQYEFNAEEAESMHRVATDLFNFGNSLTVKGGILTVADDLLKNDGKKFIEMMEQLAERRMKREQQAQYASHHPPIQYNGHDHPPAPEDEEFDDDEEEYEDEDEEYDEEEDDMDTLTEDQRMAEGRRMFQLFAARLFEQRVLTAFRQRIADERQRALLEELEDEKSNEVQREAKKQREAQKRKEKKEKQKQAKAEEKARKEAEKKAEEEAAKALELQKQEEQKKRKEEQRRKKEAERKAQEEERLKKDAEKARRQQEERERQQEAEKKAREQKAQEKKARDDARRREQEEKEAKEREVRDKKLQAEKQRKEREDKAKAEKEAHDKAKRDAQSTQTSAQTNRRTTPAAAVALPPMQRNPSSFPSPHVAVATPAIPKAPTPVRARAGSQQGSKGSSPKTPHVQANIGKPTSPLDATAHQAGNASQRKTVLPKTSQTFPQASQSIHSGMQMPPPGINAPEFGQSPLNGFPQSQAPGMRPQHAPMFPMQSPHVNPFRPGNMSMPQAPPGMTIPNMPPIGRMFDAPPPFQQPMAGLGATQPPPGFGAVGPPSHAAPGHGRQASGSSSTFEPPIGAGPRQSAVHRPSSVKPTDDGRHSIDDLSHQFGSSVLVDDSDELLPSPADRRPPGPPGLPRAPSSISAFGASPMFAQQNQQRMDSFSALGSNSNTASSWGTPPSGIPFGQGPLSPGNTWNSPATGGWPSAVNSAASPLGGGLGLGGLGQTPGLGVANNHNMIGTLGTLGRARPIQLRTTVCSYFRQLHSMHKDFSPHSILNIMRAIESVVKPPTDSSELLTILDTEGSEANGGGTFDVQVNHIRPESSLVRWAPPVDEGKSAVGAVGEIGSVGSPGFASSIPVGSGTIGGLGHAPPPGIFPGLGAHHGGYH